jgi:hypothetical protein
MIKTLLFLCATVISFCTVSIASAVLINFDDLAANTVVTNQYQSKGAIFSSNGTLRILDDPYDREVSSPHSLLPDWQNGVQSDIRIDFGFDVMDLSLWIIDVGDWSVEAKAYNSGDTFLEMISIEHSGDEIGLGNQDYVPFAATNIAYLTVMHGLDSTSFNDGFIIDDLSYSPVPEPGTILLLGIGLFGLAGFGRKKFKK